MNRTYVTIWQEVAVARRVRGRSKYSCRLKITFLIWQGKVKTSNIYAYDK